MKKLLALATSLGLLSTYGFAADLPTKAPMVAPAPPPAYNWTGFYIGINGGYGWGNSTDPTLSPGTPDAFGFFPFAVRGNVNTSFDTRGGFGGGQIGYNWQLNPSTVVGLETDFQGADINGSAAVIVPSFIATQNFTSTANDKVRWFGTARVRGGILVTPNFLVYATGGLAYGEVERSASFLGASITTFINNTFVCASNSVCLSGSESKASVGWVLGGGVEWALWSRWTLRAEYQHIDLGGHTINMTTGFPSSNIVQVNFGTTAIDTVRGAINYRF